MARKRLSTGTYRIMTPYQIVRRAVALARHYATSGNHECARRLWRTAEWHANRCGGVSGTVPGGGIVLDDGFVAWFPVRESKVSIWVGSRTLTYDRI